MIVYKYIFSTIFFFHFFIDFIYHLQEYCSCFIDRNYLFLKHKKETRMINFKKLFRIFPVFF